MEPTIITPFEPKVFTDLRNHVHQVRRLYDWPGIPYHDANEPDDNRFNRWYWHNLPLIMDLHHSRELVNLASMIFVQEVRPSYAFLSMYGPQGVCPRHTDRPQCQFTIDLAIDQDSTWPIYIDDKPYELAEGQAVCYSGTGNVHYRKKMSEDSKATYCSLAFFHFVPRSWMGPVS